MDGLSYTGGLTLARLPRGDQRAFLTLAENCHLGVNLRKEFLRLLYEISRRDKIRITALLNQASVKDVLGSDEDLAVKVERLRGLLRRQRYPELTKAEETFHKLRLSPGMHLEPPEFFEQERYTLTLLFSSAAELTGLLTTLNRRADKLRNLLIDVNDLILGEKE